MRQTVTVHGGALVPTADVSDITVLNESPEQESKPQSSGNFLNKSADLRTAVILQSK